MKRNIKILNFCILLLVFFACNNDLQDDTEDKTNPDKGNLKTFGFNIKSGDTKTTPTSNDLIAIKVTELKDGLELAHAELFIQNNTPLPEIKLYENRRYNIECMYVHEGVNKIFSNENGYYEPFAPSVKGKKLSSEWSYGENILKWQECFRIPDNTTKKFGGGIKKYFCKLSNFDPNAEESIELALKTRFAKVVYDVKKTSSNDFSVHLYSDGDFISKTSIDLNGLDEIIPISFPTNSGDDNHSITCALKKENDDLYDVKSISLQRGVLSSVSFYGNIKLIIGCYGASSPINLNADEMIIVKVVMNSGGYAPFKDGKFGDNYSSASVVNGSTNTNYGTASGTIGEYLSLYPEYAGWYIPTLEELKNATLLREDSSIPLVVSQTVHPDNSFIQTFHPCTQNISLFPRYDKPSGYSPLYYLFKRVPKI